MYITYEIQHDGYYHLVREHEEKQHPLPECGAVIFICKILKEQNQIESILFHLSWSVLSNLNSSGHGIWYKRVAVVIIWFLPRVRVMVRVKHHNFSPWVLFY